MYKLIIITNNPLVKEKFSEYDIIFKEIDYLEILKQVRDMIHKGHKLLTHPLSGSVKPNETPYKSLAVSKQSIGKLDMDSLMIIEKSIETTNKFYNNAKRPHWKESILEDFQLIDKTLIENALKNK
ncbi:GrdX family protein [Abyssisolibacter fermentans]|uniref:GrdX family protein n=1 Tax=Abyssisolibacter fermentans TaxID=1766203 RepID=UPI000834013D